MNEAAHSAFDGPYAVYPSARAMVHFASCSAITIATLLVIPDAFGILPDVPI